MIEMIEGLPDDVVAIRASGRVTAEDYDKILIPAIEDRLKKHKKIRVLYQLGKDVTVFTPGAMWDDAKVGIRHITSFEKVAVVSDIEWIVGAVKFFAFLMPCPVRIFSPEEFDNAKDWVSRVGDDTK